MNPDYLSKLFKKNTGSSLMDYVTKVRIERAKELLERTVLTISEIAIETGYSNTAYFTKMFKKYTNGVTPREYRKGLGRMKNRKLFFKRFVMGIVIFFMAVFELQMIWGSVYISKTVTKERRNSYASALEIYSSNLEQQLKQIDDFLLQSVMIENDARSILESTTELNQYLAEVRMRDTFDEELSQLKMLSGVMWYGKTANVTKKVIRMRRGQNNASVISKWIAANTEGLLKKVKENAYVNWFVYEVEGSQILVRILNNRETYMIGWLDISQIFQEFEKTLSDVKEEKIFLKAGNETAFQDKIQSVK